MCIFEGEIMKIKLSPKELKPGIITLEAITTPSGQILSPAGSELTRQIINSTMSNMPS